jgi:ABC-type branched-subunit amino acid transport system ATPase component
VKAILKVDGLTVRFGGVTALDGVSFDVHEGQFVGLIGPNGAGKTTFMDAVTGMVPSRGRVVLDGRDINALPSHRRMQSGLARTFQSLELFEDLTVRDNLTVAAERARWFSPLVDMVWPRPSREAAAAVERAIDLMRLGPIAEALPPSLSLGQRKIVTIGRALAAEPRLLLLDEPAAGLDSQEGLTLGNELRRLVAEGVTIVMIDHDMGLVLGVTDRVHVLDFGRLIASGTPDEVRNDPTVIRAYLGEESPAVTA